MSLQQADDNAIGRYAGCLAAGLGMGITLNCLHDSGTILFNQRSLSTSNSISNALIGRCLNRSGEMLSNPPAGDLREYMASDNSCRLKGEEKLDRTWLDNSFSLNKVSGEISASEGTYAGEILLQKFSNQSSLEAVEGE